MHFTPCGLGLPDCPAFPEGGLTGCGNRRRQRSPRPPLDMCTVLLWGEYGRWRVRSGNGPLLHALLHLAHVSKCRLLFDRARRVNCSANGAVRGGVPFYAGRNADKCARPPESWHAAPGKTRHGVGYVGFDQSGPEQDGQPWKPTARLRQRVALRRKFFKEFNRRSTLLRSLYTAAPKQMFGP